MMKRFMCFALSLMMLMSLAACGGGAPEPSGGSSPPAAGGDAPNESVKTVEAHPEIGYGPQNGLKEDDYKFAFSFGGIAAYADPIPGMANKAAAELGIPEITVQTPQNWVQNEQNQILDGLISSGSKAIMMMPSEATAGNQQITKMVDAGIPVVCIGGPPDLPSKCTLTLATDVYQAAYDGAVACIKAMGEKGNLVALSGMLTDTNTSKRLKGVEDAVAEYPEVTLIQTIADIENGELSMTAVSNLLAARANDIDGIVATTYETAVALAVHMLTGEYEHIAAVGTDTDEKVIEAIVAGNMAGTMAQNPWAQGYIGMYTMKMLKDGWTYKEGEPEVVNSGSYLITANEANGLEDFLIEEAMNLMSTWTDRFNPPGN